MDKEDVIYQCWILINDCWITKKKKEEEEEEVMCIYTMEYYAAIKNEILPFATMWMELEGIMLSEINQSEKDNYHMMSLIGGV